MSRAESSSEHPVASSIRDDGELTIKIEVDRRSVYMGSFVPGLYLGSSSTRAGRTPR